MAKRIGPSGKVAVFRSRPHEKPSILGGFLCLPLVLSPPLATLEEVP